MTLPWDVWRLLAGAARHGAAVSFLHLAAPCWGMCLVLVPSRSTEPTAASCPHVLPAQGMAQLGPCALQDVTHTLLLPQLSPACVFQPEGQHCQPVPGE